MIFRRFSRAAESPGMGTVDFCRRQPLAYAGRARRVRKRGDVRDISDSFVYFIIVKYI